ncbi:DUF6695 family protein [Parapedobacter deserti]|uniref:DUF6695 family protein n=1 Tax=Parapedobacter deserti TaxID=1912957 RepID=A0ABV7JNH2_9SPHI
MDKSVNGDQLESNVDVALVIAWPDKTARGDERWMALLKQVGIVKNLNFRVGHAAIVLIHRQSGLLAYYDFGRYVTPRGYGRARSAESDPRLALFTRAQFDRDGRILNLQAILRELQEMECATHGGGRLFFSMATDLSYTAASRVAQQIVDGGPVKYGAVARGNNSCSRFVAQVLLAGWSRCNPARRRVLYPESFKPSPMSNVVNAAPDKTVYCYHHGMLKAAAMTRWQSLRFQVDLLRHNFSLSKAQLLPCDRRAGSIGEPERPPTVPQCAHWLGGIGEGAWFALEQDGDIDTITVVKYNVDGHVDYKVCCQADSGIDPALPYQFTYDCHHQWHVVVQNQQRYVLKTCQPSKSQIRTA